MDPNIFLDLISRIAEDATYGVIIGVILTLVLLVVKKVGRRKMINDFT